jgi:hypothetical protein
LPLPDWGALEGAFTATLRLLWPLPLARSLSPVLGERFRNPNRAL